MSRPKDFTFGLISGALIGSVVALLYAPDKGSNTRDVLSYRLSKYMEELTHLIDKLSNEKEAISDAKRKGDMVVEDARQRAEDLIQEAEDLLGNIEDETKKTNKKKGSNSKKKEKS